MRPPLPSDPSESTFQPGMGFAAAFREDISPLVGMHDAISCLMHNRRSKIARLEPGVPGGL